MLATANSEPELALIFCPMQRFIYFSFIRPSICKLLFYTKSTAQAHAQARAGPKLIIFLHPSAESWQLSSDSLSPEFRSLALLYMHADHFINDCAYGSIGFIILDMPCELIFYVNMLHVLLRAT